MNSNYSAIYLKLGQKVGFAPTQAHSIKNLPVQFIGT